METRSIRSCSLATELVGILKQAGITVQEVLQSVMGAMFRGDYTAAFIRTDLGVVELVVLPGAKDAEEISITYTRSVSLHQYTWGAPSCPRKGNAWTLRTRAISRCTKTGFS